MQAFQDRDPSTWTQSLHILFSPIEAKQKQKQKHTHTHTHARTRKDERARCLNETDNSDITSDMILLVSDSDYVATRRQIGSAFSSLSSALKILKIQFFRK